MNQYPPPEKSSYLLVDALWDIWCSISIVGIWPRFIEPWLLQTTKLELPIKHLSHELEGLKIVQFSDLHLHGRVPTSFLQKITHTINDLSPDLILFSGDFLCSSQLRDSERLNTFLNSFKAPLGCYAVLGNHDYSDPIAVNNDGEYDIMRDSKSLISRGFSMMFKTTKLTGRATPEALAIKEHEGLIEFLRHTPFELLNNRTKTIKINDYGLNISGLGEYTIGKTDPVKTFANYDQRYPGIVLLHNPDGFSRLKGYPGDIVLCGHTHGGQINLPWIWQKLTLLENMEFKMGLLRRDGKWLYINRGVGATVPFRFCSVPELLFLTLKREQCNDSAN